MPCPSHLPWFDYHKNGQNTVTFVRLIRKYGVITEIYSIQATELRSIINSSHHKWLLITFQFTPQLVTHNIPFHTTTGHS